MTLFGDYICGNMTNILYDAKARRRRFRFK